MSVNTRFGGESVCVCVSVAYVPKQEQAKADAAIVD